MKRSISRAAAASAVLLVSSLALGTAQAATVIFSDDFNSNSLAVPGTPAGWTIIPSNGGSVDRIGKDLANTTSYDFLPGNGIYIDMVGTATNAEPNSVGAIYTTSTFDLAPGTYTLSYLLAGSQRGDGDNSVEVIIGDFIGGPNAVFETRTLGSSAAFQLFSATFIVQTALEDVRIGFRSFGTPNDNQGLLLDNVTLAAVPLPAAAWLLLSGLVGFGFVGRRRNAA